MVWRGGGGGGGGRAFEEALVQQTQVEAAPLEDVWALRPVVALLASPVVAAIDVRDHVRVVLFLLGEPERLVGRIGPALARSLLGARLSPPPSRALLLLQTHLLLVGLVPVAGLHKPLVGPQSRVRRRHALLQLVQLRRQHREPVHLLRVSGRRPSPPGANCRPRLEAVRCYGVRV